MAIAAITAAELLQGVELGTGRHRAEQRSWVEDVLRSLPMEVYDLAVARAHAALLAHTKRSGRSRGAYDLIVAATAVARERTVVTLEARGFDDLPGVEFRSPA